MSTAAIAPTVPVTAFERRFGHPPGLFVLFFAEMWERFSYYGMRGLLKLYMVNYLFVTSRQLLQGGDTRVPGDPSLVHGWGFVQHLLSAPDVQGQASVIYGWYTGLVYLTPLIGGAIADRYLGQRRTVFVGGTLMAIGHFVMAFENHFFLALTLLILGNGAFKPNISTQVGGLYAPGDPRRDGAFTIFYMGINLGAFICNFICGTLAAVYGWHYGFAAAGVGMCLGLVVYAWGQRFLAADNVMKRQAAHEGPQAAEPLTSGEWRRIGALVALCALNIVFWGVYEQQGNTMQTWADEQTHWPMILGFQVPSTWFQSFNPFCIFLLAPLLDRFWLWQNKRGTEPTSVTKMGIGCIILGLSFIIMVVGTQFVPDGTKGSAFWPLAATLMLTVGELYLSPIGLSLVTKVSPARVVSMMMGMWFMSSFFGGILNGYIGTLYTVLPKEGFFALLMVLGLGAGAAMFAFNRPIKNALGQHG